MKNELRNKLSYLLLFLFITAFGLQHNPPGGWYQQFLPDLEGRQISDIAFADSLTGFALATISSNPHWILKTTDGGDSWFQNYTIARNLYKIQIVGDSVCYIAGARMILKTTNLGISWDSINAPEGTAEDMSVLNEDTIWIVGSNALVGGLFRTTNGGQNWQQLYYNFGSNPEKIYMYDSNLGFMGTSGDELFRTTNGGLNWTVINGEHSFTDMKFIDSLTGWRADGFIYKTTNGGINWTNIPLPQKSEIILFSRIYQFSVINKDTIWGVGSEAFLGPGQFRGLLYITTNGGDTWGYQLPDSSIHSLLYRRIQFIDKNRGWAYWLNGGVRTLTGGDSTILLTVKQLSSEIPEEFKLYQNYPNPFNPITKIVYDIKKQSNVKLIVYDITGKRIVILIDYRQAAGKYEYIFNAENIPSGIYFYKLSTDNSNEVKKMMLIK